MIYSSADPRVLGYLGRALSLELSAVQLYSTQAQLVASWGLAEPAGRLREEVSEELSHAQQLIARMLSLGVAPNASQLRPVQLGSSLEELLEHDQAFEAELVQLYEAATRYCAQVGDHDNRLFFEGLLEAERGHGEAMAAWLEALRQPGPGVREPRVTF
jgi:bacterioferritin